MTNDPGVYGIGFDLGGTRLKSVALSRTGEQLAVDLRSSLGDWKSIVRSAHDSFAQRLGRSPASIGLAAPGLVSPDGASIACLPGRLQGLESFDWTAFFTSVPKVPILNDAHAALVGEGWLGCAKGLRNCLLLTLGTGVGGAILIDGRLYRGANGRAGHFGHMTIDMAGPRSAVNTPGTLELAIGDAGIGQRSMGAYHSTSALLADAARGLPDAMRLWATQIKALGASLASLINAFDPECIILGGGIAEANEQLFQPLREALQVWEWRPNGLAVPVLKAALGDLAGAYGACFHGFSAVTSPL